MGEKRLGAFFLFVILLAACGGGGGGGGGEKPPAGTLDETFGTGGVVLIDRFDVDFAYDAAFDSTGRLLAAGYVEEGDLSQMAVWCFDGEGQLDTSFGTDGMLEGGGDAGYGIAVDSADRIVVAGRWVSWDMAAWRFDSGGAPDGTFGTAGAFVHDGAAWAGSGPGSYDRGFKAAIDGTGRIVITGESINEDMNDDMVVWRLKTNGFLDTDFGGDFSPADGIQDGFAVHNGAASTGTVGSDHGYDLALDSQGRILVGGESRDQAGDPHMTLWRYNLDGTLDTAFGGDFNPADGTPDGFAVFPEKSSTETAAVDSGDRVIAAGYIMSPSVTLQGLALWRCTSAGLADTTFGTDLAPADGVPDGVTVFNTVPVMPTALALDVGGRILVAGYAIVDSDTELALFRFNTDGSLDITFGEDVSPADGTPDGFVLYDAGPSKEIEVARSIQLDGSGRILLVGGITNGSMADLAVWRFNP